MGWPSGAPTTLVRAPDRPSTARTAPLRGRTDRTLRRRLWDDLAKPTENAEQESAMSTIRRAEATWSGTLADGSGAVSAISSGAFTSLPVSWAARTESSTG